METSIHTDVPFFISKLWTGSTTGPKPFPSNTQVQQGLLHLYSTHLLLMCAQGFVLVRLVNGGGQGRRTLQYTDKTSSLCTEIFSLISAKLATLRRRWTTSLIKPNRTGFGRQKVGERPRQHERRANPLRSANGGFKYIKRKTAGLWLKFRDTEKVGPQQEAGQYGVLLPPAGQEGKGGYLLPLCSVSST